MQGIASFPRIMLTSCGRVQAVNMKAKRAPAVPESMDRRQPDRQQQKKNKKNNGTNKSTLFHAKTITVPQSITEMFDYSRPNTSARSCEPSCAPVCPVLCVV